MKAEYKIGVLLFEDFELLDVFGPLEMFGLCENTFQIDMVAESPGSVASAQGPKSVIDSTIDAGNTYDILLIPGGRGTREQVKNQTVLDWLTHQDNTAKLVTSVCTGSALLAKSGVLNGRKATTNKLAFDWVAGFGPEVDWQEQARWVEDGKYFTASGVSAGMDMALAVISKLLGQDYAEQVSIWAEYSWHQDPSWDPFSRLRD